MVDQHLRQVFPGARVLESSTFASGMAFPIHKVVLQIADQTVVVVIKLYPAGFESAFIKESWALEHLSDLEVSVPRLMGRSTLSEGSALLMEWVDGAPLMERLIEDPGMWMSRFVDLLLHIHQPVDALPLPETFQTATSLQSRFENDFHIRHQTVLEWAEQKLAHAEPLGPVLLHQDYHPWNVLVRDSGELVVLDWDWSVGDPREDLAWSRFVLQKAGRNDLAAKLTELYCARLPDARPTQQVFDVLAHLRWLNLLERPSAKAPVNEDTLKWIQVLKAESYILIQDITGIALETL